jgi:hypothetical protein
MSTRVSESKPALQTADSSSNPPKSTFKPTCVDANTYDERFEFGRGLNLATNEQCCSGKSPIGSFEIGDCITIFAIEKNANGSADSINGYHVSVDTDNENISEFLDGLEMPLEICLIGGNDHTTSEGQLLSNIENCISKSYGDLSCVTFSLLNQTPEDCDYCSACLEMDGTLTYCYY